MKSHLNYRALVTFLFVLLFLGSELGFAQQADDSRQIDYRIVLNSELEMKGEGISQKIESATSVRYSNLHEGDIVKLSFREIQVDVNSDGSKLIGMTMNGEFMDDRMSGEKTLLNDAPEELKGMLNESFGRVLSEFSLDENGKVRNRKDFPTERSKEMLGQVGAARLIHVPFYRDTAKWESPAVFGIGNGGTAEGILTYEFKSKDDQGKTTVVVSGELIPNGGVPPAKITEGVMKVSGTQVYDPGIGSWESASIQMDVKFNIEVNGKLLAEASGEMNFDVSTEE